jgi:hypothetical protein
MACFQARQYLSIGRKYGKKIALAELQTMAKRWGLQLTADELEKLLPGVNVSYNQIMELRRLSRTAPRRQLVSSLLELKKGNRPMTPTELSYLSTTEALSGLRRKEFSSAELAQACLNRIESLDGKLHSFITVTSDLALERARKAKHELGEFADSLSVAVELSSNTSYHPFCRGNR